MTGEKLTIGNSTLYHGDCLEILPTLAPFDAVVTDPPYGIKHKGGRSKGRLFKGAAPIEGDQCHGAYQFIDSLEVCTVAFFSPYNPPPIKWRSVLVWVKGAHVGGGGDAATCFKRDIEFIGIKRNAPFNGHRDSAALLNYRALSPPPTGHFCEKPEALMSFLISKLGEAIVLDPYMGTGTTGVACVNLGRTFIGIEKDRKWFDIACERIEAASAQRRLFA